MKIIFIILAAGKGSRFGFKENKLFYKAKSAETIVKVKIPELLISQFFVTNETLYIYDGKNVNQYQLIND